MGTSDIIAIIIVVVCLATIIYFIVKHKRKSTRVKYILKSYPTLAMVLLNRAERITYSTISKDQTKEILSLSDNEWLEWYTLSNRVKSLAEKYPDTFYEFILEYYPECKDRLYYKKNIKLFSSISNKVKVVVESLELNELRKIDADSENIWKERDNLRLRAIKIRQKYPEGYQTYCDIHKVNSPEYNQIVNDKKHIEEFQILYDESKGYDGWEEEQKEFSSDFWQILKDVRSQDGRYSYDVAFQKPDRKGILVESEFKVWQGFCDYFSSYLLARQTEALMNKYNLVEKLKDQDVHFVDSVYEDIFKIANRFNEYIEGDLYVCLVDQSKFNWPKSSYDYHYRHICGLIDKSGINRFNLSELPLIDDLGNIEGIFLIDIITSNEDLKSNCKYIIEHFKKSVPLLGYYSLEKEYDKEELLALAENNDGYLDSKEKDIEFIKNCLLQVKKHPFFSYLAIPNTWIGEAEGAKDTKMKWLNQPNKYDFKTKDEKGYISGEYSTDRGNNYEDIAIEGSSFNVDDTARFTYQLFKEMGVLSQFKQNGQKAIEYMNSRGLLSHP